MLQLSDNLLPANATAKKITLNRYNEKLGK